MTYTLHHGDCLEVLATLHDCSVDAIVTDPPAGVSFMGLAWDRDKGGKTEWVRWMQSVAAQCRRVIKPGGHALVWAIPRTSHWTGDAWEEAGWQVRDKIYHVFGSGFPKSMDVSKQLDRMAGAEREVVGVSSVTGARQSRTMDDGNKGNRRTYQNDEPVVNYSTAPATPEAKQWAGWGTALKPAAEEWWLFRRPLEGTVAANVLKHGTGAINVDGTRIQSEGDKLSRKACPYSEGLNDGWDRPWRHDPDAVEAQRIRNEQAGLKADALGRWPANFTHDGSDEVTALLGDAARFFYSPKASQDDRNSGDVPNTHATVKSQDLMTYLCRLITPPGGTILDPFTGSGSTGKAAILEDFKFIGIEREAEYIEIAKARIDAAIKFRSEFLF